MSKYSHLEIHPRTSTVSLLVAVVLGFTADSLLAHGSIQTPASRVFKCRFEDNPESPQDPACAAAVAHAGSPQFLYDWNGIRQGDAAGQHQAVVPDGELCSGGDPTFSGLDLVRNDWRATTIMPDANGMFTFVYHATAPHSTQDMLFFVTRPGWDPSRPLTWEDLDFLDDPGNPDDPIDPFCHLRSVTLETLPGVGDVYRMTCLLPDRTGPHVIYHVWQRDDSPEAFYACVDVVLGAEASIFGSGFETGDLSEWSLSVP